MRLEFSYVEYSRHFAPSQLMSRAGTGLMIMMMMMIIIIIMITTTTTMVIVVVILTANQALIQSTTVLPSGFAMLYYIIGAELFL